MALRGQHEHNLDSKDRITVPARFRAELAQGVVLSAGLDPCVDVYPLEGFERFEQRFLADINPMSRKGRMLNRRFYSASEETELDGAGRLRLPRHLIEHAGLAGECTVVGVGDHLEIWSKKSWLPEKDEVDADAAAMAEELVGEGEGK